LSDEGGFVYRGASSNILETKNRKKSTASLTTFLWGYAQPASGSLERKIPPANVKFTFI
jgi:hypothetical protein